MALTYLLPSNDRALFGSGTSISRPHPHPTALMEGVQSDVAAKHGVGQKLRYSVSRRKRNGEFT